MTRKIFNDPVHGFVTISDQRLFDIIEHPWFQRLRRIKQLSLTGYVYPGALHTRFHHAIGATHLMTHALNVLRTKGQMFWEDEIFAAQAAILLHDIGHGPYSHTLEHCIIQDVSHEDITVKMMQHLSKQMNGALSVAIEVFQNNYARKALHQLVSSQLDMDRLDYLARDSFFTGVSEGKISTKRIIEMMEVVDDEIVIESKGIYSIEKFIIARRLMYWQVYLHKTVLCVEEMLIKAIQRVRELVQNGNKLPMSPQLAFLMQQNLTLSDFDDADVLNAFCSIDDTDILYSVKMWSYEKDTVLSVLCKSIIHRRLFKVKMQSEPFEQDYIHQLKQAAAHKYQISEQEAEYFVFYGSTVNRAYQTGASSIKVLSKDGATRDIAEASDQLNISVLSEPVTKHFLCYPKDLNV